jgi:RNA polymerase sigma-70 factor, ECF subfamily
MTNEQISVILRECIDNNRSAQHEFFHLYRDRIYEIVYRILGANFDTDDVVQQIFIALFNSLKSFRGNSSLDTWVYRICLKICTTQLRKKYRKRQICLVFGDNNTDAADEHVWSNPASEIEQNEISRTVYEALDKLSMDKRMIVILYEMEGKTLEEISTIVEKPVGTVKSRLFHGRKALEKFLRGTVK